MSTHTRRVLLAICALLAASLPNSAPTQVPECNPVAYIVAPASGPENGIVPLMFFVYRIGGALGPTSIQYSTYDLTATSPSDYYGTSGTLTFNNNSPSGNVRVITVFARPDSIVEPPETLQVFLYGTGTQPPITSAVGTIEDSTTYLCNNNGACGLGETPENCPNDCWVNPLNCDYNSSCGWGENSKDCPSDCGICNRNGVCDGYEKQMECPSDCPLPPLPLLPQPSLSILDTAVPENGLGFVYFMVARSGDPSRVVTVNYATGTAEARPFIAPAQVGTDYVAKSGTLTFYSGETAKLAWVSILDDLVAEGEETFAITLASAQGATISKATAEVLITDNEWPACDNDGLCDWYVENSAVCPSDCAPVCDSNGWCEFGETNATCPSDCSSEVPGIPCNHDGVCSLSETTASCSSDCPPPPPPPLTSCPGYHLICAPPTDSDGSYVVSWSDPDPTEFYRRCAPVLCSGGLTGFVLQRASNLDFSDAVTIISNYSTSVKTYTESQRPTGTYYYRVYAIYSTQAFCCGDPGTAAYGDYYLGSFQTIVD